MSEDKLELDIFEFREVLEERVGRPILIGGPRAYPVTSGNPYITFINGIQHREGEMPPFCGTDVPISEVVDSLIGAITDYATEKNSAFIVLREGVTIETRDASFSNIHGGIPEYRPKGMYARARVAFFDY
jgi:hypothetical protein